MKNLCCYALLASAWSLMFAVLKAEPIRAHGLVFHDLNENGARDVNEPGIADVLVSNGRDFVKTNHAGAWSIELQEDSFAYVVSGKGWAAPVDANGLPQFYYAYEPNGSATTRYAGQSPTGTLPESIDFPMLPTVDREQFSVLVFGDPQPSNIERVDFLAQELIAEVSKETGHIFGMSLGDIVSNNLDLYSPMNDAFSILGLPWYNVAGNHDINFDTEIDTKSDETFERVYGPSNYVFQFGKVHFFILDNVYYEGENFANKVRSGEIKNRRAYVGGFREDQFQLIENYLKYVPKDELIVMSMHIPLFQRETSYYKYIESFRTEDRKRLFNLLSEFEYTVSLSAHTHFQKQVFFDSEMGWQGEGTHHHFNVGTTCGDWFKGLPTFDGVPDTTMRDGTPNGYLIMEFDGVDYRTRYKVLGAPESKQISLTVPRVVPADDLENNTLYANFYMGTEYSWLMAKFDGLPPIDMEKSTEPDPRNLAMHAYQSEWLASLPEDAEPPFRIISDPQPCSHLWKIALPSELEAGFQKVVVTAVDRYGRSFEETTVFRVE